MPKQSKQIIIDAIVKEIENGIERGKCLSKFVKKWQISDRTFDRYWKTANQQQQERQRKASEAADKAYIESKAKAAKQAVMSKQERLELLTKIARGKIPLRKAMVVDKEIKYITVVPDWMERKAAVAEINKMEGDYAPMKNEFEFKGSVPFYIGGIKIDQE